MEKSIFNRPESERVADIFERRMLDVELGKITLQESVMLLQAEIQEGEL